MPVAEREYVRLPEVVIAPPDPEIKVELAVFIEVTVPPPPGVTQVPSPLKNVVADPPAGTYPTLAPPA